MPEQGGSWESPADGECSQGARTLLMLGACDFAHAAQTGGGALLLAYRTRCQSKRHLGRRKAAARWGHPGSAPLQRTPAARDGFNRGPVAPTRAAPCRPEDTWRLCVR